jgi:putative hydrolase of the HAD superfamily
MAIKAIVFDWGDTVMRDFPFPGPMKSWPFVSVIPDMEETLTELKKDYYIILASNAGDSTTFDIIDALERVGLSKYFHHVFSSKDLGFEKPDIRFFQAIEKELKLSGDEVVMIGNNCEKDIKGAHQLKWKCVWFNEDQVNKNECKEADATIYHMAGLSQLIKILSDNE